MANKRTIAESESALHADLAKRMDGVPVAYRDGDRVVPVRYHVEAEQLTTPEDVAKRELYAQSRSEVRKAIEASPGVYTASYRRYVNAQQSDDGIGTSFMTRGEKALASMEWGQRLRDLLEAGKVRDREREERRVLVDLQCEDD